MIMINRIKKRILILFLLIIPVISISQTVNWTQTFSPAEPNPDANESGKYIAVSNNNEIYFTGIYSDTIDFDYGTGVTNLIADGAEGFIIKLNSNGVLQWAGKFEGTGYFTPDDITTDNDGNIVMIGTYFYTVDVDPGISVTNMVSNNSKQVALLKINNSGDLIWAKQIGSNITSERCYALKTDSFNNILVMGNFSNQIDADPDTSSQIIDAGISTQLFILKLNPNGQLNWVYHTSGEYNSYIKGQKLVVDNSGSIYATGWFRDSIAFDPNDSISTLIGLGFSDIFILKLSSLGNLEWVQAIGSNYQFANEQGAGIVLDNTSSIYITGTFRGIVDFDNGPAINQLYSNTSESPFILKLDTNGAYIWAKCLLSSYLGRGTDLELDCANNIVICGMFQGTIDFDPSANNLNATSAVRDGFIGKYSNNGNLMWAYKVGGVSNDEYISVIRDSDWNFYSSGYFYNEVDFDPSGNTDLHNANSSLSGVFLQKWYGFPCTISDSIMCQGDTCIFFGTPLTNSGTFNNSTSSILFGCDSINVLNLTVLTAISDSVSIVPATCGNNNGSISITPSGGAGTYTFLWSNSNTSSTITGLYGQPTDSLYVTITDANGCTLTDTAIVNCLTIIAENNMETNFNIYPNPANGIFTLTFENDNQYQIEIYNILGENIFKSQIFKQQMTKEINLSGFSKGIYFVKIDNEEQIYMKKIVLN